jgi:hypothetical protein
MKLWVGNPEKIPNGYTYVEGFEDAVSFIHRCHRIRSIVGDKYDDLWAITEINVPFDEVDKYASLFSYVPKQDKVFLLNSRTEE